MKRLHEILPTDLENWKRERARVGQLKYGDRDTKRYNLVDLDELLPDELCTDENGGERIWWGDNR